MENTKANRIRKSILLSIIASLVVLGCGTKITKQAVIEKTNASTGKYRLVWNDDPTTTMTVAWDQLRGTNPMVHYGSRDEDKVWQNYPYSQQPTRATLGYRGMNTHFAKLQGLKPDQKYYFIIRDSEGTSERFWFKTAPDQPKPFTCIVGADTKSGGSALEAGRFSLRMVAKLRPLFIVFNGDFTSGNGTDDENWMQWLNDWAALTTTSDGRMFPIVPIHGNHENGDKTVLNKIFDAPYQLGDPENIYYSISFGGNFIHIIGLNSEIDEGGSQRLWLEKDLKAHDHFTFKLAGYHKPFRPHTQRKSENDYQYEEWAPLFNKYGLDISMDGDSHMSKITFPVRPSNEPGSHQGFIRDDEKGTMYIGEGSWGAGPRDSNDDKPWTLRSGNFNQFKWIQVFPETAEKPALMEIRTVITMTEDEDENIVSHVENVSALSEDDVFTIPDNIKLYSMEPYGSVIRYPISENDWYNR